MTVTIGADPELFIRDERTGAVHPAIGMIGGTKQRPIRMEGLPEGYTVQEDNVMAEYNIPPATRPRDFSRAVGRGLDYVQELVRTRQPYYNIDFASERMFTYTQLDHMQARHFGCSPDFDAYMNGRQCEAVSPLRLETPEGGWRFAGGHVHIGYPETEVPPFVIARFCDLVLGLRSVALDKQEQRRALYGRAGRFRQTGYGIEYRTLSNFWIFDDHLRRDIGAIKVGLMLRDPDRMQHLFHEIPWDDVQRAINEEDEALAADVLCYTTRDLEMQETA